MAGLTPSALQKKRPIPDFFEIAAPPKKFRLQDEVVHQEPGSFRNRTYPDLHTLPIVINGDDDDDNDQRRRRLSNVRLIQATDRNRALVQHHRVNGVNCEAGEVVELHNGTFLRIKTIWSDRRAKIFATGDHLVRATSIELKMPRRMNELVWEQKEPNYEVPVSDIWRRREVIFTNQQYPLMSLETDHHRFPNKIQAMAFGPLFCRWKSTVWSSNTGRVMGESFEHLRYEDADDKVRRSNSGGEIHARIDDAISRLSCRDAPTLPGGSYRAVCTHILDDGRTEDIGIQQYTFGDGFCGAGGASRGARDAGLFVKWGFDMDDKAMGTYRLNFARGGTDCREEAVHEFLNRVRQNPPVVDILHLSPPCQPFSPAHTIASPARDDVNQAAMFSACQMLEIMKPRVITMEETFGLLSRHPQFFCALIKIFISRGYSIRYATLECQHYGVPQTRTRLFVIASAPGEKLPELPRPTHGSNGAALVTISDQIGNIPRGATDHEVVVSARFKVKSAYSGQTQAKTLTCGGGERNYHPSGLRPFTIRESASLQTFPWDHLFGGGKEDRTAKKKQIGNAVPPAMAKALFEVIISSLKETDGVE